MTEFYSQDRFRRTYQEMLETVEAVAPAGSVSDEVLGDICEAATRDTALLEVGCGSGRFYRQLRQRGFAGKYTGTEMAEHVIASNQDRHPEATWEARSVYHLPWPDESFDLCLLFYVLEHLVRPERALRECLRMLRPGGRLVLVFPDFVATGQLPSQQTGLTVGSTRQKLSSGR